MERDDHDRTYLKHLLENSFEVVDFGNDFDAVEYIKRNTIDLAVLSDNLLENINGARLLLALRENSRQTFRAFALVSRLSEAQQNHLNTAGFEKIICRPVHLAEFNDLVYFRKVLLGSQVPPDV